MEFSFLLVCGLGFSVLAEMFHLHFILGAFLAGLFFTGMITTAEKRDAMIGGTGAGLVKSPALRAVRCPR
ncbi:MAG: Kef-type K+ transport system membrane component KefB [Verrucomicrobiales bacterium]|jgi:Kef-type K+ transport system membrane component KefB